MPQNQPSPPGQEITPSTRVVHCGMVHVALPESHSVLECAQERIQREGLSCLFDTITSSLAPILNEGMLKMLEIANAYAAQGKKFHPIDLGERHDPPVPLTEAYPYTGCGCIGIISAMIASRYGLKGVGVISGLQIVENPGRSNGHIVGVIPPCEVAPHGAIYEAGGGVGPRRVLTPFRPMVTLLGEGDYQKVTTSPYWELLLTGGRNVPVLFRSRPLHRKKWEQEHAHPAQS